MKRFSNEFRFMMKNRKHFFFLIVVWSVLAVSTLAYGLSLKNTVSQAFVKGDGKLNAYNFEIEGEEKTVISNEVLKQEVALNELLCNDEKLSYCTYINTTCTMAGLGNLELSVDADSNSIEEPSDGQKSYKVRLLMVDYQTAVSSGLEQYTNLFKFTNDYGKSAPVVIGSEWADEIFKSGNSSREIITGVDSYTIQPMGVLSANTTFTHGEAEIVLDKYIVFPLGSLTDENFPTTQNGRNSWYDIYRVKNQGTIHTDMTANNLQKYLDELMEKNELPFRLLVKGSDHDNKILFKDNAESIALMVINVGYVALVMAALMMIFYLIKNYDISSSYLFLSYITGTGKVEFIFVSLLHMIVFFILSTVPSYVIVILITKLTASSAVGVESVCIPVAIITIVGMMTTIVRILLWDAGKKLRTIEE